MTAERTFRQHCDSCGRMRTTVPSLATYGGWRPFADWWMCPSCVRQVKQERMP